MTWKEAQVALGEGEGVDVVARLWSWRATRRTGSFRQQVRWGRTLKDVDLTAVMSPVSLLSLFQDV